MMDSSVWLIPATIGLGLDIYGVILLAGPLLNVRLDLKGLNDIVQKNFDEMKKYEKEVEGIDPKNPKETDSFYMAPSIDYKISNLTFKINKIMYHQSKKRLEDSKKAKIAVAVITCGFLLIIVGNVMQVCH